MDNNEPVTNPKLLEAIRIMKQSSDSAKINQVINEVMKARFLSPVEKQGQCNDASNQNSQLHFFTLEAECKERYLIAFSDWEEAHRWKREGIEQSVILCFDDYASMILEDDSDLAGFVINPANDNIPFQKDLIASLKKMKDKEVKQRTDVEQIRLIEPDVVSQEMVDALCAHLKEVDGVSKAYVRMMQYGVDARWLIVVDADRDNDELFHELADIARPFLHEQALDILPMKHFQAHTFDTVKPFYQIEGYIKDKIKQPSIAIIEDTFTLDNGGCVLGCFLKQGAFDEGDEVDVVDYKGKHKFRCHIARMEQDHTRLKTIDTVTCKHQRVGMQIADYEKTAFMVGDTLHKKKC